MIKNGLIQGKTQIQRILRKIYAKWMTQIIDAAYVITGCYS